ncbi:MULTISPECIES: TolC family outer membrane protein [unclassified Halomonas]|uniref:TolC family outer membrane protein n=1 Tax=unclassified Halomonas TaxID=2609666 RepID=UPI0007D8D8C7|nr:MULTISPECIES: TolC family outer membrane protein [unclassified Halomonas]MBT2787204.1 TolC family outer membrane protein [Halomonas sp. ISL-106]MBT2796432.1 TolC family outer membrane protein [Halomonas sp. ISL-104]OAL57802.1 type I secretion protein TolC [Halomonas sp. ALS9]
MTRTPRFTLSALALAVSLLSQSVLAQSDVPADQQALTELQALANTDAQPQVLPSLPGLFARALRHDSDLTRQRYELDATREEIPMARSQLLPRISASGGYLWQDSTNIQTSPDDFGLDQPAQRPGEIDETYYQVQLQQPLFSLERWRKMGVADAQVSAAELQLAVLEQEMALQVSEAYIKAYLASQRLGLLESQQDSLDLQVRQASRAFDLGIGNRVDLLEAQSRYDQAVSDAVEAENELDNSLSELERLTGVTPRFQGTAPGELTTVTLNGDIGDPEEWISRTGQNLNVLLAQQEQEIAQADTSVRRSGYYPEINLSLSYSDRTSDDELRESEDYRANVELSVPIYRGGYTNASVRQGEKRIEAGLAAVDNERNLAVQQVRQRIRSLNGGERRLEALNQAISSSQLFLEAAERGEQLGLRDLVDVLDARASLYDQRIKYVDTVGDYALDMLALHTAVGSLESGDLEHIMTLLASLSTSSQVAQ